MAMFLLTDAPGIGAGDIDSTGAFVDLVTIANETAIGLDAEAGGQRLVTYARTLAGPPQVRLDLLVNTTFTPDYGAGAQNVDIIVISVPDDFVFGDGSFGVVDNGTALPPSGSGLGGAALNPTVNCLVLYDTDLNICVARDGTGGTIDLGLPGPVVLYHELSHATRIVQNTLMSLAGGCDPSSPEENAAIIDENDLRTQLADVFGTTTVLRDPGNHCGGTCPSGSDNGCCIVASVASGSTRSEQVRRLRRVRDRFVRTTGVGFAFFEQLFDEYYSFSPQISTMIAGEPALKNVVLRGYVEPLLDFWELMAARSHLRSPSDAELGELLVAHAPTGPELAERLATMELTRTWWERAGDGDEQVPASILDLLRARAVNQESVRWALLRPLDLYERALRALDPTDRERSGAALRGLLDVWTPDLPISPFWGALAGDQVARELAICDDVLLQTPTAQARFRAHLRERFEHVTSIRALARADVHEGRVDEWEGRP